MDSKGNISNPVIITLWIVVLCGSGTITAIGLTSYGTHLGQCYPCTGAGYDAFVPVGWFGHPLFVAEGRIRTAELKSVIGLSATWNLKATFLKYFLRLVAI